MRRRHFVLNLLAAGLLASPALAGKPPTYVFTSFDPPGSTGTSSNGINNAGAIAGAFSPGGGFLQGFVLSAGVFSEIQVPGAVSTTPSGINDVGVLSGTYHFPN